MYEVNVENEQYLRIKDGVTLTIREVGGAAIRYVKYEPKGFDRNAPKYDLMGRRVDDSYKGIYIQNNQKFINYGK